MSHIFDLSYITNYQQYCQSVDNRKIFLGKGTNGSVYKVFIKGLIPIAVKEIILDPVDYQKAIDIYEKETKFLKSISHPNIIKVYFSFLNYNQDQQLRTYYIGMEYALKDLKAVLAEKKIFKEQEVSELAQQLYRGLEFIQSKNAVHRDIKPANIVLGTDGFYKLCDFGEIQTLDQSIQTMALQSIVGSPAYFSPELFYLYLSKQKQGKQEVQLNQIPEYNPAKSDVFSFGLVLLQCLLGTNENIFGCNQDFETIKSKMKGKVSKHMQTFLLNSLCFDRQNRYSFNEMKKIFEFNVIETYFEAQEFNPRAFHQQLQNQMNKFDTKYEQLKQANLQLENECKTLSTQLASITTIVQSIQTEQQNMNITQMQNKNNSHKIKQKQQQHIKKTAKAICQQCDENEKSWKNRNQNERKCAFEINTEGLKWNYDYYYNYNEKNFPYSTIYNNNYQFWNNKTGNKTYWRWPNGKPCFVIEKDIHTAIKIVQELENSTCYEFGLCLMMLHSNLWDIEKTKNDLLK